MRGLLINIFLAASWAAVSGRLDLLNLSVGFALGFVILLFTHHVVGATSYIRRVRSVLELAAFFLVQLVAANFRVAYEVLTPNYRARPGILAIPLDAKSDVEITVLANLISLTPGTLSLDLSDDRSTLFIHTMYIDDVEKTRRDIKNGFERRVIEVFR
ncbi:MAG: Na+/H+ antiporter subunit E [Chloroflexota bacterium]|nr:Na+/H+ antiporter subunit E [Dehalococcoidia bacterium]MDW8252632.1 Na+/H+ antiporter subunit E [Chloroflexota bacterium]